MKKILILCTGNSCRSQMAEGFLKSFDSNIEVYSAGVNPSVEVHPKAVHVMREINIDISRFRTNNVNEYLNESFDFVITVCDNAKQTCPIFMGTVKERLHMGFKDPADASGTENEILNIFQNVRDEMRREFYNFYQENILNNNKE